MENISLFIDDDLTRDDVNSLEKKFPSAVSYSTRSPQGAVMTRKVIIDETTGPGFRTRNYPFYIFLCIDCFT